MRRWSFCVTWWVWEVTRTHTPRRAVHCRACAISTLLELYLDVCLFQNAVPAVAAASRARVPGLFP